MGNIGNTEAKGYFNRAARGVFCSRSVQACPLFPTQAE
jgi:hypothetical protein